MTQPSDRAALKDACAAAAAAMEMTGVVRAAAFSRCLAHGDRAADAEAHARAVIEDQAAIEAYRAAVKALVAFDGRPQP